MLQQVTHLKQHTHLGEIISGISLAGCNRSGAHGIPWPGGGGSMASRSITLAHSACAARAAALRGAHTAYAARCRRALACGCLYAAFAAVRLYHNHRQAYGLGRIADRCNLRFSIRLTLWHEIHTVSVVQYCCGYTGAVLVPDCWWRRKYSRSR